MHFLLQKGDTDSIENDKSCINPWSISIVKDLLRKMHSEISKYDVRVHSYFVDVIIDIIVDYVDLMMYSPLIYNLYLFLTSICETCFRDTIQVLKLIWEKWPCLLCKNQQGIKLLR